MAEETTAEIAQVVEKTSLFVREMVARLNRKIGQNGLLGRHEFAHNFNSLEKNLACIFRQRHG
jgi:hypothetical protein